jgi:tetraacyldisaccharide 4'-kinase
MTAPVIALTPPGAAPLALPLLAGALAARGRVPVAAIAAPGRRGPVGPRDGDATLALLAAHLTLYAAPTLAEAVAAAAADGADAVLAAGDPPDATLRIACLHARQGISRLPWPFVPRGAPLRGALRAADLLILIGTAAERAAFAARHADLPPTVAAEPALLPTGMDWAGARLFLVAAAPVVPVLATLLSAAGATVAGAAPLDPEGALPRALLARIAADARARAARLAAPEADALRLPPAVRRDLLALPLRLTLPAPALFDAAFDRAVRGHSQQET